MAIQKALKSGPNRFNAVCTYGTPTKDYAAVRAAAASLIDFFERETSQDNLRVLVALGARPLEGIVDNIPKVDDLYAPPAAERPDVLVQISAQSDVHRLYAMRVVAEALTPVFRTCTEVLGQRLLNGQDPLGFQDRVPGAGNYAKTLVGVIEEDKGGGGSYLFFRRFALDVKKFFEEHPAPIDRARVVGVAPMSDSATAKDVKNKLKEEPSANSHVALMKGVKDLVRRGFSYRHAGKEGLVFVGVSKDPATFRPLLEKMVQRGDQLLAHAKPEDGGMFFVPPSAESFLDKAEALAPLKPTTLAPLSQSGHLTSYDTTTAFFDYLMFLKQCELFDDPETPARMSTAARPCMDALYLSLAQSTVDKLYAVIANLGDTYTTTEVTAAQERLTALDPKVTLPLDAESKGNVTAELVRQMKDMEAASFTQARAVNANYDQYITYG